MSSLFGTLETSKLDKADVVDPAVATEDGKAADAKKTKEELDRILGVASGALSLAESKADKLSSRQLEAVNSGIDADKVAKIAQNEIAISAEVSRATTEEARLRELVNAIKTFDAVVADSLPGPSEQYSKKLYLVPSTNPETRNVKDEFICVKIGDSWSWEQVGSTAITIEFDDEPTEGSQKAARSGGIWSWVKSLLPRWLTSDYAEPATVASVANKADKTTPYYAGNLAALTADGNLADSGKKASDFAPAVDGGYLPLNDGGTVNGETTFLGNFRVGPYGDMIVIGRDAGYLYKYDSEGIKWYYGFRDDANEIAVKGDISALSSSVSGLESSVSGLASSKADKAAPATLGNLAALTADGNLADSGKNASDFAPAVEGGYLPLSGGTVGSSIFIGDMGFTTWLGFPGIGTLFFDGTPGGSDSLQITPGYDGLLYLRRGQMLDPSRELAVKGDISGLASSKADKATNATSGHIASLTEHGDLGDSGIDRLDIARMYGNHLVVQPGGMTTTVDASMLGYSIDSSDTIKDRLDAKADLASFAPQYSATSAYSVGAFVYHDGNIYQCKTAIADGGEAWNAEHWELRKLDDFFTESNSLLTATIAANSARLALDEDGEIIVTMNTED